MPKTPRNGTVRNDAITTHYSDQRQIADAHSNSLVPRGFTKTMVSILISSGILVVGFQVGGKASIISFAQIDLTWPYRQDLFVFVYASPTCISISQ